MKSVLPALTGKDYASLEIQEGAAASREFLRVTFGDVTESERSGSGGRWICIAVRTRRAWIGFWMR